MNYIRYYQETFQSDKGKWYHTVEFVNGVASIKRTFFPDTAEMITVKSHFEPIVISPDMQEIQKEEFETGIVQFIGALCKKTKCDFKATESYYATHEMVAGFDKLRTMKDASRFPGRLFVSSGLAFIRQMVKSLGLPVVVMLRDGYVDQHVLPEGQVA